MSESPVRVDTWIWAVRIAKTRTLAGEVVKGGHVKIDGETVKASAKVVPGHRVSIWIHHRQYDLEVVKTPNKRVGAPIARTCYVDHSPPPPAFIMPQRDRGAGRPTKKDRRQIEKLRGY